MGIATRRVPRYLWCLCDLCAVNSVMGRVVCMTSAVYDERRRRAGEVGSWRRRLIAERNRINALILILVYFLCCLVMTYISASIPICVFIPICVCFKAAFASNLCLLQISSPPRYLPLRYSVLGRTRPIRRPAVLHPQVPDKGRRRGNWWWLLGPVPLLILDSEWASGRGPEGFCSLIRVIRY